VLVQKWESRTEFRVAVVRDLDELCLDARIDVHLAVAHVRHQVDPHRAHLVVHEVTRPVAGVAGEDDVGVGARLDLVDDLERLDLQPLGNLQRHQTVVALGDALRQLIELEVVPLQVQVELLRSAVQRPLYQPLHQLSHIQRADPCGSVASVPIQTVSFDSAPLSKMKLNT